MNQLAINTSGYLLKVNKLRTYFPVKRGLLRRTVGYVKAVDGISFGIRAGQTLGLVGESGCGKTTLARSIVRLVPATAGEVVFDGIDVLSAKRNELRQIRRQVSIIFQDPYSSLNPRMTVGDIVGEPLKVQGWRNGSACEIQNFQARPYRYSPREISRCRLSNGVNLLSHGLNVSPVRKRSCFSNGVRERVAVLLSKVGLSPEHINRYPHEFSGGQRQRIGIARALVLEPRLVICDEPVSSLDVSIQAQILNLLKDLQEEFALTYLFIAHDLAVVEFFCDVVAVMYMGKIVEQAGAEELYRNPLHPYTRALISAIPQVEPRSPAPIDYPIAPITKISNPRINSTEQLVRGCAFNPRCPLSEDDCLKKMPILEEKSKEHFVACWRCKKN